MYIDDIKVSSQELYCFLMDCGFRNQQQLDEYIVKVQKYADFIGIRNGLKLIGLSIIYTNRLECDFAYITYIAVSPLYRGLGLGNQLLKRTINIAREKGINSIRLEVLKSNVIAISFYRRWGFSMFNESENSIFMEKSLL